MSATLSRSVARQHGALDEDQLDDDEMTCFQPVDGLAAMGMGQRDIDSLKDNNIARRPPSASHTLRPPRFSDAIPVLVPLLIPPSSSTVLDRIAPPHAQEEAAHHQGHLGSEGR